MLEMFLCLNKIIGETFLYVLIVFSIIETYSLVWLFLNMKKNENFILSLFLTSILLDESLLILCLYIYFCKFSKYLHFSSKLLLKKAFKIQTKNYIKVFSGLIVVETIHNKRRFGFTYSSFGLMTKVTFVKYVLLYCNLIRKIYRLQQIVSE